MIWGLVCILLGIAIASIFKIENDVDEGAGCGCMIALMTWCLYLAGSTVIGDIYNENTRSVETKPLLVMNDNAENKINKYILIDTDDNFVIKTQDGIQTLDSEYKFDNVDTFILETTTVVIKPALNGWYINQTMTPKRTYVEHKILLPFEVYD